VSSASETDSPDALDPQAIARRLAVLPERAMRAARLASWLEAAPPDEAAWVLDVFSTVGRAGGPPYFVALLAAVDAMLAERVSEPTRRAIHAAATANGLEACKELLFMPVATGDVATSAPRPLVPGTRPLTLGERKALARSWRRDVIERLLTDPAPDVVALLLANPHVTEDDVLRIATARRSTADVLRLLLGSPRWSTSGRIRVALVRNPRLPLPFALGLVGLLDATEARDLAGDHRLPLPLRAALQRRIRPTA
jgi:hypothetical protein